jgi:hypothetical protein
MTQERYRHIQVTIQCSGNKMDVTGTCVHSSVVVPRKKEKDKVKVTLTLCLTN